MLRSVPALATLSGRRSLSEGSQQQAKPPTSTASSTTAPPTTTAPPPPPPPPRSRFLRRAIPLALGAGIGYTAYKASTDNEFRAAVKDAVPGSEYLLQYLPTPPKKPSNVASSPSPSEKSVSEILLTIEESKRDISSSHGMKMPDDEIHNAHGMRETKFDDFTASERAAMRSRLSNTSIGDEAVSKQIESAAVPHVKPAEPKGITSLDNAGTKPASDVVERPAKHVDTPKSIAGAKTAAPEKTDVRLETKSVGTVSNVGKPVEPNGLNAADSTKGSDDAGLGVSMSGKAKLARLLGKGDFATDKMDGGDVVNGSAYQKPEAWKVERKAKASDSKSACPVVTSKKKTSPPPPAVDKTFADGQKDVPRDVTVARPAKSDMAPPSPPSPPSLPAAVSNGKSSATKTTTSTLEADALRAELASQAKWEAVRLQEAVRAQLVEDKKQSAKDIAALEKQHAEEVTRVRDEARQQSEKLMADRTRELIVKNEKERDSEVQRLLRKKEEELMETLRLEFAQRQEMRSAQREAMLLKAKAEVEALSQRFGAVVEQTALAKEATRRASGAFMLHEAIGNCGSLRKELGEACGKSDIGALVAGSVPEIALSNGVRSVDGLKADFESASKRGLSVAVVPEGHAGSMWAHVLGSVFSRLKVRVDMRSDGDGVPKTNEQRIRLAQQLVEEGDIESAVSTLDTVDGIAANVLEDWVEAAKARIAAGLAADVLLADAIIAQVALTSGE